MECPFAMRSAVPVLLCLLAAGATQAEEGVAFLPEVSAHLTAARYDPVETDLQWTTWIGAGAGLVRVQGTTLCFAADVETTIGNGRRTFDATQANYHLDADLRHDFTGERTLSLLFHHVSRHLIDTDKAAAVDWNVLGVEGTAPLPRALHVPGRIRLSLGHTTKTSFVTYRWEARAGVDAEFVSRPSVAGYIRSDLRFVTTDSTVLFARDHFLDVLVEGGVRFRRGGRTLETFAAFERRHDVFLLTPGDRDRALFGFHIRMTGSGPAPPAP